MSSLVAVVAGIVKLLSPWIDTSMIVPLYIGCLTLPPFSRQHFGDIARSHDWMRLGLNTTSSSYARD